MPVAEQGASSRIASTGAGGLPFHDVGGDDLGREAGAREILGKSRETTFRSVDRGHLPAGGGELHRLAARRGAEIERRPALARPEQPRGKRGGDVLHPPAALAIAGQAGDGGAARQAGDGRAAG